MIVLLLKVTLLWALALAIQPLLRRSSAAMRHLVHACALAGALLLPLTLFAPPEVGAFRINGASVLATSRVAMQGTHWHVSEILAAAWAVGSALLLLRIVAGHLTLSRLLREATPLTNTSGVPVYLANISVPMVAGLSNPVILLPHSAEAWTDSQRSAALKHELQHVDRKDLWTMTIGHLACAIYWFHPLAWAVARLSRQEQESACDDAVLASGFEPASYADALVAAARHITSTNLIGCHMLTRKTLKSRIARLFDSGLARIPSRAGLRGAALASVAAIAFVGMLVGTQRAAGQQGAGGQVFKVGSGVSAPSIRAKFDPEYTPEAQDAKLSGTVLLSVVIGTDGIAHDINVVKPLGMGLDEKAVEAVQKWLFNPGMKNGEPVNVRAQIEINFRLQ
jgi:TonB family protein